MRTLRNSLLTALLLLSALAQSQTRITVNLRIATSGPNPTRSDVTTAAWLEPVGTPVAFVSHTHYTLLQKNRTFLPHAQVVPVGATVEFPNADPFFHNVFSLFDGRRFDLGLYEAGTSKSITFPREGVSYIFCNIHPEMSAVILTLNTPFYELSRANQVSQITGVPPGAYTLHIWVEGVPQSTLNELTQVVQVSSTSSDLGTLTVTLPAKPNSHLNKFGKAYAPEPHSSYQ